MTTPSTSAQGPVAVTREMAEAGRKAIVHERARVGTQYPDTLAVLAYQAMAPLAPPAASPASPSGVRVKPLSWSEAALMVSHGWLTIRMARTPFGIYAIDKRRENELRVTLCGQTLANCLPATLDDAKAAAQSDYEARIMSALASAVSTESSDAK